MSYIKLNYLFTLKFKVKKSEKKTESEILGKRTYISNGICNFVQIKRIQMNFILFITRLSSMSSPGSCLGNTLLTNIEFAQSIALKIF